ncbi:leucine-rich repeat-containing protein 53-like, partial [Arapaima gigas]
SLNFCATSGVLIGLLMLITHAQFSTSCPASCVVCSEDAIICHKLSNVIEVPNTTKILMLTDGQIQLINNSTLSILSNITVLGLSGNIISNIMENAFHNLTLLKTLLLDHNHISSLSILNSTFTQLQNLEVLQLGHNAIQNINRNWFQGLRSLLVLHLEGNLITRLPADTFQSSNLENLETLDLSDNLIESLSKGSFYGLPRLRNLDLSRNSLRSAPDAFSYLSWLSALNLDLNEWNCTCELWELSSFLSSYIQAPDKVLYNGRQMVCLSTANPAVQTVLQLTEANCVPPNQNITVLVKAGNSISMNHYARDISLAAFFFFFGKPWRDWNCDEVEEEIQNQASPQCSFTGDNDVQILTITHPGHQAKLMLPNSKEQAKPRVWLGERGLANSRAARTERYFSCHQCSPQGTDPVSMKYSSAADPSRTTVLQNLSQTLPYTQSRFTVMDEKRRPVAQPLLKSNAGNSTTFFLLQQSKFLLSNIEEFFN